MAVADDTAGDGDELHGRCAICEDHDALVPAHGDPDTLVCVACDGAIRAGAGSARGYGDFARRRAES